MVKVSPSILASDLSRLADEISRIERYVDYIHLDVMDGHFVPNITVGIPVVAALRRRTRLPLDVHLMIANPANYVDAFIDAGADILTVHIEADYHAHRTVQHIRSRGVKAGIALNPSTPPEAVEYLLPNVDLVLVMTVNPGFGGQAFIETMLPKIRRLRTMLDGLGRTEVPIEVDGGINSETAPRVVEAGARWLVAGSAVYASPLGVAGAIQQLRTCAEEVLRRA